jgi:hypothetical protein
MRQPGQIVRQTLYASQHTLRLAVNKSLPIYSIKKSKFPTVYVSLKETVKDKVNSVYKQHNMMEFRGSKSKY